MQAILFHYFYYNILHATYYLVTGNKATPQDIKNVLIHGIEVLNKDSVKVTAETIETPEVNVTEDVKNAATKKMQEINKAKEAIFSARKMN